MSTTLIVLAAILAISAFVLILFMMTKVTQQKSPHAHTNHGTKQKKKNARHK